MEYIQKFLHLEKVKTCHIKMGRFRYVYDDHPRDKERNFLKKVFV